MKKIEVNEREYFIDETKYTMRIMEALIESEKNGDHQSSTNTVLNLVKDMLGDQFYSIPYLDYSEVIAKSMTELVTTEEAREQIKQKFIDFKNKNI